MRVLLGCLVVTVVVWVTLIAAFLVLGIDRLTPA